MIAWFTSLLRRLGSIVGIGRGNTHDDDFDPELREVFFAELEDVTQLLERAFASWRANSADQAAMQNLRRGFHTIKGSALMVGATALGDFCRHLEQLSIRLMEQQLKVTPAMVVTIEQAITQEKDGVRFFEVIDEECVGCNLCMHVCPVDNCITMERVDDGSYRNWTTHPNNPMRKVEA